MGTPTAARPPTRPSGEHRHRVDPRRVEAGIIAVVAFLVIFTTAPDGMWLDETISVRRSGLPLTTLTSFSLGGEPNMALFHYLLWPLGQLHASDAVFRIVPVAAGALTLAGTYLLGCRLFDRPTAVIATGFLAVHGLTTRYATEVRGYSLVMLLMVWCALLLTDAVRTNRRRSWILFTVLAVSSFGLHFVAVLFVVAQLAALLVVRDSIDRRRALTVAVAIATGILMLGLVWLVSDQDYWVAWLPELSDEIVLDVVRALAGGTTIALLVVGVLVLFGSWRSLAALRDPSVPSWPNALVLSAAWIPILGGAIASVTHPLSYPRYFLAVLPPIALLLGRAVMALPRRPVLPVSAAAVLLLAVVVGHTDLDRKAREGTNEATAYVTTRIRSGDGIFLPYNEDLSGFQWYADGALPDDVVDVRPNVPPDAIHTDWWWEKASRLGPDMPAFASATADEWRASLQDVDRVWVVSGFVAKDDRFHDTGSESVPEGRVVCDRQFFAGIDVVLWARSCD